jgi:virginiamycin B lyase
MTLRRGLILAVFALLVAIPAAIAETPGAVQEYPLAAGSNPRAVVNGPGGMWIAVPGQNTVARLTVAGGLTTFPLLTANAGPEELVAANDGNVWFTEKNASRIGRITPDGAIAEFPTTTPNAQPQAITAGSGTSLYFTMIAPGLANRIGQIDTTTGTITEFPVPSGEAFDIAAGPDGSIWYTAPASGLIGRFSFGSATEYPAPGGPTSLATADSTSLWYTEQTGNAIGKIATLDGTVTQFPTPSPGASDAIIPANDGTAWFTKATGQVGNITPAGAITEYSFPASNSKPDQIALGPDRAIWVPETTGDQVARVSTSTSGPVVLPPVEGSTVGASTVSGTVKVKLPGKGFSTLGPGQTLPVGTVVDTTGGTIELTATSGTGAQAYAANFFEGTFQIAQKKGKGSTADLNLAGGNFKGCPKAPKASSAKKGSVRHLWGAGSGQFKTVGRFSSATVRGTKWLTDDQCKGTLVKVTQGTVLVRDFVKRKNVTVKAGKQYFAHR